MSERFLDNNNGTLVETKPKATHVDFTAEGMHAEGCHITNIHDPEKLGDNVFAIQGMRIFLIDASLAHY